MPPESPIDVLSPDLPVRLAARGIDVVIVGAIDVGLGLLIGFGFDWLLIGAAIVLAYFSLFDAMAGATPGKLVSACASSVRTAAGPRCGRR